MSEAAEKLTATLRARLVHGATWSIVGTVASRGSVLAASVIVARVLGREIFGQFGMVQTTVIMLHTVIGGGLGAMATRYVAEARVAQPARAGRVAALTLLVSVVVAAVFSAVLFGLAQPIATHLLADPLLAEPLRIASTGVVFGVLNGAQVGVLIGVEGFRASARASFWGALAGVGCASVGVWLFGLPGALAGTVLSLAVQCALSQRAMLAELSRHGIALELRGAVDERHVLHRFGLPSMLASALASPVNWAMCALLAHRPGGYYELGAYNAANQWFTAISILPMLVSQALMPILSQVMVGSSRVDLQACKLEYSIVSPK